MHFSLKSISPWDRDGAGPPAPRNFFEVTQAEAQAVLALRVEANKLSAVDPRIPLQSDNDLLRLVRARSLNVPKAVTLLKESELERQRYMPVRLDEVQGIIAKELAYTCLTDEAGRPVIYVNPDKFRKAEDDIEHITMFILYIMNDAIELAQRNRQEQVILLFDLTRFSMLSMDKETIRRMLHILMAVYPERVYQLLVYNPPYFFSAVWTLIKPWLDENSISKIHFMRKQTKLYEFVGCQNLPTSLGGTFKFNSSDYLMSKSR